MLSLRNIVVQFDPQTRILNGLNLEVANGEFVVIIGANGTGKSTLFNLISGDLIPTCGNISIDGRASNFARVSRVFQDPRVGTIGDFTIMENMALALRRHQNRHLIPFASGKRRNFFRERLATLGMNLENRLDELVSRLSGGQRQALSLLMSVISDYKILLLDEITAALDPKSSEKVMSLADKIVSSEGKTCLMVTHNMHHARAFGDRTVILQNGIIGKQFSREEKQTTSPQDFIDALDGQG